MRLIMSSIDLTNGLMEGVAKHQLNLVSLVYNDLNNFLDMVGTTKATQGTLTITDIPTELRNRITKQEAEFILNLAKAKQQERKISYVSTSE